MTVKPQTCLLKGQAEVYKDYIPVFIPCLLITQAYICIYLRILQISVHLQFLTMNIHKGFKTKGRNKEFLIKKVTCSNGVLQFSFYRSRFRTPCGNHQRRRGGSRWGSIQLLCLPEEEALLQDTGRSVRFYTISNAQLESRATEVIKCCNTGSTRIMYILFNQDATQRAVTDKFGPILKVSFFFFF